MAQPAPAVPTLRTVVFIGSSKQAAPPWGGDARLGDRVVRHVVKGLRARPGVRHEVTVFDPIVVFGPGGALEQSGAEVRVPHFFLTPDKVSRELAKMDAAIKAADCYVVISPEYNHSIPPALSGLIDNFAPSSFANKVSGIVTYSPGPYGGVRAAMALRPFLSEVGCVSVSKLACLSNPAEMLTPSGDPTDPAKPHQMLKQVPTMLDQLEWTAVALKLHKERVGVPRSAS